jgi:phytoene/squalene synthetase
MDSIDSSAIKARCRELASECLRLIPVIEEQQKPVLLEMAEYWTTLADKIERRED